MLKKKNLKKNCRFAVRRAQIIHKNVWSRLKAAIANLSVMGIQWERIPNENRELWNGRMIEDTDPVFTYELFIIFSTLC